MRTGLPRACVSNVLRIVTFSRIFLQIAGPGERDGKTAGEGLRIHSKESRPIGADSVVWAVVGMQDACIGLCRHLFLYLVE